MKAIALVGVKYWPNVFNVLRVADAFGWNEVYTVCDRVQGITPKMSRALAEAKMPWGSIKMLDKLDELRGVVRAKDYNPVLFDLYPDAIPLSGFTWPENPIVILGAEDHGIPPELLDLGKSKVAIPMLGKIRCMNVACAAGIALYDQKCKKVG